MKLSALLSQRRTLLRQARLANLAFAYERLTDYVARVHRAKLTGNVCLRQTAPEADRFWASLTALQGSQAVLEEHFADEDIMDLADVIAYATGETELELTFPIEELQERFLAPVRNRLVAGGVILDRDFTISTTSSSPSDNFGGSYSDDEL